MTNWKEYKLGELLGKQGYIRGPFGSALKRPEMKSEGFAVYEQQHAIYNTREFRYFIDENKFIELKRFSILPNDLIISCSGTVGEVSIINEEDPKGIISQALLTLRPNLELVKPKFLYYFFKTRNGHNQLISASHGSVQINIAKREVVESIPISVPNIETQNSIIEILSSLDDKIELNNKINRELENLAQTLFKRWFIDFEFPVNCLHQDFQDEGMNRIKDAQSRKSSNLANQASDNLRTYRSSGGEMVDSELGEIPKGWEVYSMSDLLETVSKTYPLKAVEEVIFLNTGDIHDGKFLHNNLSNSKTLPGQAKKSISKNDILYSEIRPANKRFAFVHFDASKYVVSTKLMVMRSKVNISSLFQYFILTQKEQIDYLQRLAESRSGTFPQITFTEVSTIKIALPSFELVNQFVENVLSPFFENKFNSEYENQELTNLRDTLLPKLISGELEVKGLNLDWVD